MLWVEADYQKNIRDYHKKYRRVGKNINYCRLLFSIRKVSWHIWCYTFYNTDLPENIIVGNSEERK